MMGEEACKRFQLAFCFQWSPRDDIRLISSSFLLFEKEAFSCVSWCQKRVTERDRYCTYTRRPGAKWELAMAFRTTIFQASRIRKVELTISLIEREIQWQSKNLSFSLYRESLEESCFSKAVEVHWRCSTSLWSRHTIPERVSLE